MYIKEFCGDMGIGTAMINYLQRFREKCEIKCIRSHYLSDPDRMTLLSNAGSVRTGTIK
jgi:hypothetical protein